MTVDVLIETVLKQIWESFYAPKTREFCRDKRALMKAIARYGYHCEQRGWNVDPSFIAFEIGLVIEKSAKHKANIEYLPVYLDAALTRAIGQKAEELKAAAMMTNSTAARIIRNTTVVQAVREPTSVEVLSMLYKSLNQPKPKAIKCSQGKLFSNVKG